MPIPFAQDGDKDAHHLRTTLGRSGSSSGSVPVVVCGFTVSPQITIITCPDAPCMEYMPISWGGARGVNVGIYGIHGASGMFGFP